MRAQLLPQVLARDSEQRRRVRLLAGREPQRARQVLALEAAHRQRQRLEPARVVARRLVLVDHVGRQALEIDLAPAREHHRALDRVLQLAHVPGKRIRRQRLPRPRADRRRRAPRRRRARQKMLDQERQVFAPLAQRRDAQIDPVQSIIQVLPKAPVGDAMLQVLVRRRHDAHVDR